MAWRACHHAAPCRRRRRLQARVELLDPEVRCFSDTPAWLEANQHRLANRRIMMYCTGGVRWVAGIGAAQQAAAHPLARCGMCAVGCNSQRARSFCGRDSVGPPGCGPTAFASGCQSLTQQKMRA